MGYRDNPICGDEVVDRIFRILDAGHFQQKDLADYLGIQKNAITRWKNGELKSYTKYLYEIAEFFGVPVSYLLTGSIDGLAGQEDDVVFRVSPEDYSIIQSFHAKSAEVQQAIITLLNAMPDKERALVDNKEFRRLQFE